MRKVAEHLTPKQHTMFIAASMSGKSYMIRYLLLQAAKSRWFSRVVVVSSTAATTQEYAYVDPRRKGYVHAKLDEQLIKNLKRYQVPRLTRSRATGEVKGPRLLVILDDVLGKIKDSSLLKSFFSTCRHFNITVWAALQYAKGIPPDQREQFGGCFVWPQNRERADKSAFELAGMGLSKADWNALMKSCRADKYSCIYTNAVIAVKCKAPAIFPKYVLRQ